MAAELGPGYEVVEENLNGRVTDFTPDPSPVPIAGAGLNGAAYLPAAIASQMPLDLVVVALGTNDTGYHRTALEIGRGAMRLATIVQDSAGGIAATYPAPAVLLVAPPPLPASVAQGPLGRFYGETAHSVSQALGAAYARLGEATGVAVLDAGKVIRTNGADSVHLSAEAHAALGKAVAAVVRKLVPPDR